MAFIDSIAGVGQSLMGKGAGPLEGPGAKALDEMNRALSGMGAEPLSRAGGADAESGVGAPSFGQMLDDLVTTVDSKQKASGAAAQDLMVGRSDNIHQTMIAMQESGVAFTLMVEVRNKLVESYQELMRMQV